MYPVLFAAVFAALVFPWADTSRAAPPHLTLHEALRIASVESAALKAQQAAIQAAEHATRYARELPDPKLRLGVENLPLEGPEQLSLTRDAMTMRSIGVMQEFPHAEKRALRGRRAEHELAREQAVLGATAASVRRDVAAAWFERYFAERMAALIDEQYAEAKLQRQAAEAGLRAGRVQAAELVALDANLQALLDRRRAFSKEAARATASLSRWLGPASARPLETHILDRRQIDASELTAHVTRHALVRTFERQIEVAQTDAQLAQAASRPDWGLELMYQQRGPRFSNMISVQVSIDLPILQARRQQPALGERRAQVEQAHALREEALRQYLAEARAAHAEWEAARERLARFDDALLPLARERIELALAAYRGGQAPLAPVLEARRAELELRLQKVELERDRARAYAQLLFFLPEEATP